MGKFRAGLMNSFVRVTRVTLPIRSVILVTPPLLIFSKILNSTLLIYMPKIGSWLIPFSPKALKALANSRLVEEILVRLWQLDYAHPGVCGTLYCGPEYHGIISGKDLSG